MTTPTLTCDRPLAIDLFCGLRQAKLRLRADATIQQLVARRTENPEHVSPGVGDDLPRAISLEFRFVGDLKNSRLATSLARIGKIRIFSSKPTDHGVPERPSRVVDLLDTRLAAMERAALFARRFSGAALGAIAAVCVWRRNVEMLAAAGAIPPIFGDIVLFATSTAAYTALAFRRAVALVWANRLEWCAAIGAKQIMHDGVMP